MSRANNIFTAYGTDEDKASLLELSEHFGQSVSSTILTLIRMGKQGLESGTLKRPAVKIEYIGQTD